MHDRLAIRVVADCPNTLDVEIMLLSRLHKNLKGEQKSLIVVVVFELLLSFVSHCDLLVKVSGCQC